MGLVQTDDQLRFSVDAIVQGVKEMGLEQEKKAELVQQMNGKRPADQVEDEGNDKQASAKKRKNSEL